MRTGLLPGSSPPRTGLLPPSLPSSLVRGGCWSLRTSWECLRRIQSSEESGLRPYLQRRHRSAPGWAVFVLKSQIMSFRALIGVSHVGA